MDESKSEFKSTDGFGRLAKALKYSTQGLNHMVRHEAAFRQELIAACVLVPVALWLPLGTMEKLWLLGSVVLMLITEIVNSAIEAVVDRVSLERHPLAGRAKDMGSAAVFISVIWIVVVWLSLAGPVLWRMLH
ncbi:MAG TPA: diacylglycerol kinase [Burkholderiales bacterium]|jgi:diacylglycerol kinase (ATP)|nr:diacylglycerol kinase [Burkholderiales bacterium]